MSGVSDRRRRAMYANHTCRRFVDYIEWHPGGSFMRCEPVVMWLSGLASMRTPGSRLAELIRLGRSFGGYVFSSMEVGPP